jgi:hypothetical protein
LTSAAGADSKCPDNMALDCLNAVVTRLRDVEEALWLHGGP